MQQKNKNVL